MKVTYEFKWEAGDDSNDEWELKIYQKAHQMFSALSDISDYLREWRKGWNEDDAEKMEDRISEIIIESNIGEIE